jgi:hypothetical protein
MVVHPYVLLEVQVTASSAMKSWMRARASASWSREFGVRLLVLFILYISGDLQVSITK